MYSKDKAAEIWHQYRLVLPVDLKRLVADLHLEVVTFPFRGRVKEMIVDGVIGVQPGLARPWFRWYVAHAIGHHLLHVDTSFYLESVLAVGQPRQGRAAGRGVRRVAVDRPRQLSGYSLRAGDSLRQAPAAKRSNRVASGSWRQPPTPPPRLLLR